MVNSDYTQLAPDLQIPTKGAGSNLKTALDLAERGWYVFPCREKPGEPYKDSRTGETKTPQIKQPYTPNGKDDATTDPDIIRRWWSRWPGALVGIYCEKSGFFALDIDLDPEKGIDGKQTWATLCTRYGNVYAGPAQLTPRGGLHILFKLPADLRIPNNAGKLAAEWGGGLDLRSNGYICTGVLDDNRRYQWLKGHGPETRITEAPGWLLDLIRKLSERPKAASATQPAASPWQAADFLQNSGDFWLNYYLSQAIEGNRNDNGFLLACQLRDSGLSQSEAESYMREYARRVPGTGYTESEALASLDQAYKGPRRDPARRFPGLSGGNGYHPAGQAASWIDGQRPVDGPVDGPVQGQQDEGPIPLTDMGNARRFALQHAGKVLYTQALGWLCWDGKRWAKDETGAVYRLARQTVKSLYRDAEAQIEKAKQLVKAIEDAVERENREAEAKAIEERAKALGIAEAMLGWAKKSQGKARIDAMVSLAQSEPEIVALVSDFDKDPWLLNVQNGVLDLRTGKLKPHDPGFKITKLAGASYFPDAKCPTWLNFLAKIFRGDQSLIAFLQRAAGYSLTGSTREQALFFLFGTGANGKSTFTGALQDMLGEYAMKSRAETLMVKRSDSIPEEIAQLAGVRFMLASELGEGQRLNESLVKDLTGGDKLRARLLHHNSFEFYPEAKPWLYGNHKPVIRGTDNGIWRRVNLIPFDVSIPEKEQDKNLPEKLRSELDGILAWAVQGCLKWQETGLQAPEKVQAATAEFRVEQDLLAAFLDECCIINSLATATAGVLYTAYKSWAEESGLSPMSKIAFSRQLEERGFTTKGPDGKSRRDGAGRNYYTGIGLVDTATAESQANL